MNFVKTGTYQQNLSEAGISETNVESAPLEIQASIDVLAQFPELKQSKASASPFATLAVRPITTLAETFKDADEREMFELSQSRHDETPAQECTDEDYRFYAAYHARQRKLEQKKEAEDGAAVSQFMQEKNQYYARQRDELESKVLGAQRAMWDKMKGDRPKKKIVSLTRFEVKTKPRHEDSVSSKVSKTIEKK